MEPEGVESMAEIMEKLLDTVRKQADNPQGVSSVFKTLDNEYNIEREEAQKALWLLVADGDLEVDRDMKLLALA